MVKTREAFVSNLMDSHEAVSLVAGVLERRGHKVRIIPASLTPNVQERRKHMDNGDLEIELKTRPGERYRLEVKRRKINFTSRADFPYSTVIVDEAYKVDNADGKLPLIGYLTVNAAATAALFIGAATRETWTKQTMRDRTEGRNCENYLCPIGQTISFPLEAPAYV